MLMALSPGEAFQHTHTHYSYTLLREGDVDLVMEGSREPLVTGSPTAIAPNVTHTMINVGAIVARFECGHLQGDPPDA